MKTVVWNMASKSTNWGQLASWEELRAADVSLVCEATPAPEGVTALGAGETIGLEVDLGPDKPVKRPWPTAVVSSLPMTPIEDARIDRHYKERLPFRPSRPGTWVAASVDVDGTPVTAISLYGLMDERSDPSVHRSLSELALIFDHA